MFDKVSQAAEKLATGMSRRGFLGSVSRWAGATALGLAGVLTTAGSARAGTGMTCCVYHNIFTGAYCGRQCVKRGAPCPACPAGCLCSTTAITVSNCGKCN